MLLIIQLNLQRCRNINPTMNEIGIIKSENYFSKNHWKIKKESNFFKPFHLCRKQGKFRAKPKSHIFYWKRIFWRKNTLKLRLFFPFLIFLCRLPENMYLSAWKRVMPHAPQKNYAHFFARTRVLSFKKIIFNNIILFISSFGELERRLHKAFGYAVVTKIEHFSPSVVTKIEHFNFLLLRK